MNQIGRTCPVCRKQFGAFEYGHEKMLHVQSHGLQINYAVSNDVAKWGHAGQPFAYINFEGTVYFTPVRVVGRLA